jgi:hypothetical protein
MYSNAGIMEESLEKYEKFGFNPIYLPAKKLDLEILRPNVLWSEKNQNFLI